ncbi:MAG TPA: hypothetical protein VKU37_01375 [Verrucomicrobiae bacterium]|nr:hypothetical protein [Verrucomicrobiae bacterium]
MKRLLMIFALFATASALGADDVTVKLDDVSPNGNHTNIWFECRFTIHNGTSTPLFATNLFVAPPGLALKISDLNGKELKRVYADPWINYALNSPIIPPGDSTFKEPYGLGRFVALPETVQIVRVRLEGTLSASGYMNLLTSNIVKVHVP